mmetsp:Transcript_1257/g.3008  ORF Transcript_1257/g.3008 Transcript_1257/m.3008 type:complete len:402 (+) Transcript_1257:212-1417(+)
MQVSASLASFASLTPGQPSDEIFPEREVHVPRITAAREISEQLSQLQKARTFLLRWFSSEVDGESWTQFEGFGDSCDLSEDNAQEPSTEMLRNKLSCVFGCYHWASMLAVSTFLVLISQLQAVSRVLSGAVLVVELMLVYVLFPLLFEKASVVHQVVDQFAKNFGLSVNCWLNFSCTAARSEYHKFLVETDKYWRLKAVATSLLMVSMVLAQDTQQPLLCRVRHVPVAAQSLIQVVLIMKGPLSKRWRTALDVFGYVWVPFLRLCNAVYRCASQTTCTGFCDETWEESHETFDHSTPNLLSFLNMSVANFFGWGVFKYLIVSQVSVPATALTFALLLAGHSFSRALKLKCLTASGLPVSQYAYANLELCVVSFALVYFCVIYARLLLEERHLKQYLKGKAV